MTNTEIAVLIIGYVATAITTVATLPQLIRVIRLKDVEGISIWTYLLFIAGNILWIFYGFTVRGEGKIDYPIVIGNFISLSINSLLVILKVAWSKKRRKQK